MVDFRTSDTLASKVSSESYTRRMMLKFDTQNFIPANAVIQSARLYLVLKSAESREWRPLTAFRVSDSFVTGRTNWYYRRDGQAWSIPGGDLGPSFGTTWVANAVRSTYTFDLTTLVQSTVNGEFGSRYTRVALVDTGGSASGTYRAFHSTRASNAALWPRLVITYDTSTTTTATPTTSTGTSLRVMQWNIHKTKGSDGRCDADRTANTIVAQNPDVVSLNEVNIFAGVCAWTFDMGERLQSLLQQKTGVICRQRRLVTLSPGIIQLHPAQQRPRRGADGDCRERPQREPVLDTCRLRQCLLACCSDRRGRPLDGEFRRAADHDG
jgi:hypothetical protein